MPDGKLQKCPPPEHNDPKVPLLLDWLGGIATSDRARMIGWGNRESRLFEDEIAAQRIEKPVFVAGLARAGTTILLEFIARTPDFAAHAYRDYPFVATPLLWNLLQRFWPGLDARTPKERAHKDGILVTGDSPEAFDEMIWTLFFDHLHDPGQSNLLTGAMAHGAFDVFYRDHLCKILHLRRGRRFVSKNNYNIARIGYLQRLFPDARFVVPVRDPVSHVFSLVKQHRLFSAAQAADPRALRYMQRCGHFEFGRDFRPMNVGDDAAVADILAQAAAGDMVLAYARYWRMIHEFLLKNVAGDDAVLVVDYRRLCQSPAQTLAEIAAHCRLEGADMTMAGSIRAPDYYRLDLTESQISMIGETCLPIYHQLAVLKK